ncbi:uncharacterized protein [Rhodnius prolixus]|uniref:uncharacterized protein n=1 Tax=Rhodnius prolixus TaxID=13249 RepID=UPI003D18B254
MRVIAGIKWGADREMLLKVYRTIVRSKIDYCSFIYSSARKSTLRQLDTVHNQGIRISLGVFKSSPVLSLYVEAGEFPLSYRRSQLALGYLVKLHSKPLNPCHIIVNHLPLERKYERAATTTKPFGIRMKILLNEYSFDIPPLFRHQPQATAPWLTPPIFVNQSLLRYPRSTSSELEYKQYFQEILSRGQFVQVLYTDGSKNETGCGAAVVVQNRRYKFGLPSRSSIYVAELYAIYMALSIIGGIRGNVAVCSDSISSLLSLQHIYCKHPIIQDIHTLLFNLRIQGNIHADLAVKEAASVKTNIERSMPVDISRVAKEYVKRSWQREWTSVTDNKLRAIKEPVHAWDSAYRSIRREEVVVARLRIGHTRLTHSYLMCGEPTPLCNACNNCLSVQHVIAECPSYEQARRKRRKKKVQHPSRLSSPTTKASRITSAATVWDKSEDQAQHTSRFSSPATEASRITSAATV